MKNGEKYKTVEERIENYDKFCAQYTCDSCPIGGVDKVVPDCKFRWLELKAEEEKPMPCPFCGKEVHIEDSCTDEHPDDLFYIDCDNPDCYYSSGMMKGRDGAIAAHNRVCRAVMDAKNAKKKG